ncbi:MAG: glycosyltransferase family 2 protein [Nitrospirae bacterium]|nr:MAG: glycosyltransferase family 2 protein [Nitrospirota bacterium]
MPENFLNEVCGKETGNYPPIDIVFLNYNRLSETKYTLKALLECKAHYKNIQIIAVDNASTDGTREYLKGVSEEIQVILLDENQGIGGYNIGFERCKGEYIIVLDDDSHVLPSTIERLVRVFERDSTIGLIAFKVIDNEGRRFKTWHIPSDDRFQDSFAFVGCGFAVKRDVFRSIGYYPAEFFLYHNEIEVSLKTKMKGYRVVYDPECVAVHRTEGVSRNPERRVYFTLKNSLFLIWKYYPLWMAIYLSASRILISMALALYHFRLGDFYRAIKDFLNNLPERSPLTFERCRELLGPFTRHNSIIHRITGLFRGEGVK